MMKGQLIDSETAMSMVRGCLVITLQGELYDGALVRIRRDIMEKIQATKVRAMILDLSTVRVLDSLAFSFLADTARMTSLMGVANVFVGLQPGVVSSLVDLEVDINGIRAALTMEDGFELIQNFLSIHGGIQDTEDSAGIMIENEERKGSGEEGTDQAVEIR